MQKDKEDNVDILWDHDQPDSPIHFGSSGNQGQLERDLNMRKALHYVSSGEASAEEIFTENEL